MNIIKKVFFSYILFMIVGSLGAIFIDVVDLTLTFFALAIPVICITPIFTAPLVEEYAKRISLKNDFPWIYIFMFAGMEYIFYVNMLFAAGVAVPSIIFARCLALILHFGTMKIQMRFKEAYDRNGRMGTNWDKWGYANAVCVHALWNAVCITCMIITG